MTGYSKELQRKLTERMFLNKEEESGVKFNPSWVERLSAFEQLGPELLKFNT